MNGANGGTHGGPNGSPNGGRHAPNGGNGGGRPLTVQGDKTILAEVQAEGFAEARDYLALFAELKKCPEYVHTYEITPLSIWNAAAAGLTADAIISFLVGHSRYPVPAGVDRDIRENIRRFGLLSLRRLDGLLVLTSTDTKLLAWLAGQKTLKRFFDRARSTPDALVVHEEVRGEVKQALIQLNYP
ncbi:MAG TPA: helicase-associated domain-containing protein, partial [Planctomycetota bacterium]|nr:helicase-associated domain-containing protein [Planctomycetota bacterium]